MASEPIPQLLSRIRAELSADFPPDRPVRISRAPGRLDVMGGIADYSGSMICAMPLDRAAAVALAPRDDRNLQVFSFNLFDEHVPFTLRIPLPALAATTAEALRHDFADPGRRWGGYIVGCLFLLAERKLIDLTGPKITGLNLAVLGTVPMGVGVASSAAIEVATMMNLADHFGLRGSHLTPMSLAQLCREAESRIVGAPCGIMDQVTSVAGEAGALLRMICQPHELLSALKMPDGVRVVGINSNVRHDISGSAYARTRCAAFMGHRIIVQAMHDSAAAADIEVEEDPLHGCLANLDPDDYKSLFRPMLPEKMRGLDFLRAFGPTMDKATVVNPDEHYHVQLAADHHIFEARRARQFVEIMEQLAGAAADDPQRRGLLSKAGGLMYESHPSYARNALLGAAECDLIVELVRRHEPMGLYGARMTGRGCGGTVAILADVSQKADEAIAQIMAEYERQTGHKPEVFNGTSAGAWEFGT